MDVQTMDIGIKKYDKTYEHRLNTYILGHLDKEIQKDDLKEKNYLHLVI